ncbi:MAG TPA: Uma2 family endonuclease [Hyphomicrobiaceae bacterium]|nr:Uma2 family endonuclease [Hyphomicrobiaceae bacterium]
MTLHTPPQSLGPAGRPRRLWTVGDVERMLAAGIVSERDRLELIGGELIAIAPKGARHEIVRNELVLFWARRLPTDLKFAEEAPLRLGDYDMPEPDLILFPASLRVPDVRAETVLLVVEVSDSSLSYDIEVKAPRYAAAGVREYWVIDPTTLVTYVHRDPGPDGYASKEERPGSARLEPHLVPALAVSLASLDVD